MVEGAIISNANAGLPSTTVTETLEVWSGQFGAVAVKVKSLGSFKGSIVIGSVAIVQPAASLTVIVYVPFVKFSNRLALGVVSGIKLMPSILDSKGAVPPNTF